MSTEIPASKTKLVSIICRSIGRPELNKALSSVAAQSYPNIELVLVDAASKDLSSFASACGSARFTHISTGQALTRSQAANAGLQAADGDYLMFLDDDDWIGEDHLEKLVDCLESNPGIHAAYSSTQKTDANGNPLDYVFEDEFDPILLMRDNYIPIHAMIFSSSLLEKGCQFDAQFDIYEDWDFWLQLSQHTDFLHIDAVTAFYREGGDSETAAINPVERFKSDSALGKARANLFDKWKSHWQGEQINTLLGKVEGTEALLALDHRLNEELAKSTELDSRLKGKISELKKMNEQYYRTKKEFAEFKRVSQDTEYHLRTHIDRLQKTVDRVFGSMSWKITGPLRGIKSIFRKGSGNETAPAVTSKVADSQTDDESNNAGDTPITDKISDKESKQSFDVKARSELDAFLSSKQRLAFPRNETPEISIVLIFYNQAHLSLLCLQSLLEYADVSYQLIIVDNNSTDKTSELLERLENVTVIRNPENLGFVKAVNQAAEQAVGTTILLLNNDALIEEATLSNALHTLRSEDDIGAVGAKIKLLDGSLQEAGSIIWKDGSCLGYGRGENPEDPAFMFQRDVDYCSGAFLLFSNKHFKELDGFDEAFAPAYYEESDFCIRLAKKGLRTVYCPTAQITHYEFASSGGFKEASKLQIAHREILCSKHGDYLASKLDNTPENYLIARTSVVRPNVLIIDDRVPHPSLGSGYPRCAHILHELSALDLNVSFYPLQFPIEDWHDTYQTVPANIEVILDRGLAGLKDFLDDRARFYQHIIVSRIHNMQLFNEFIDDNPNIISDVNLIYDAEAVTAPREVLQRRLLGEEVSQEEESNLIAKELEQARHASTVVAVSEAEARMYQDADYENTVVLGHTLDANPGVKTFEQRKNLLFVGALRDEGSPNVDSLLWFVINVLPIIEKAIPDIQVLVAGDNSAASLTAISRPNINFLGRLDSLADTYNSSRVFIAPTRFAAGIPHKVHEAASQGLPSVTTALLARQLGWTNNEELLIGDTADEFARQCIQLYQDSELWQRVRDNGLAAVKIGCSQEAFENSLASLFR